jgi:hypothetical protein
MAINQVHDGNQAGVTTRASLLAAMEQAIDHFARAFDTPLIKKWHWTSPICFQKVSSF